MPRYEYRCRQCHEVFEVRRAFDAPPVPAPCPRCGDGDTVKLFASPVVFAGGPGGRRAIGGSGGCGGCASAGGASCGGCRARR